MKKICIKSNTKRAIVKEGDLENFTGDAFLKMAMFDHDRRASTNTVVPQNDPHTVWSILSLAGWASFAVGIIMACYYPENNDHKMLIVGLLNIGIVSAGVGFIMHLAFTRCD